MFFLSVCQYVHIAMCKLSKHDFKNINEEIESDATHIALNANAKHAWCKQNKKIYLCP